MAKGKKTGGRQRGVPNRASARTAAEVAATGETPLDVMIDNMRFAHSRAMKLLDEVEAIEDEDDSAGLLKEGLRFREIAQQAAREAAPYCHPRLNAIEHMGKDGGPIEMVALSDKDRARALAAFVAKTKAKAE